MFLQVYNVQEQPIIHVPNSILAFGIVLKEMYYCLYHCLQYKRGLNLLMPFDIWIELTK